VRNGWSKIWCHHRVPRPRFFITCKNFGYSRTFKADCLIFAWVFRTFWPKMGVLWGKIGEGMVRYWPPNELVLPLGVLTICANFGENRSRKCDRGVLADGRIHRLTDWDTTRFLPRCMECSRGIAMGILSVRPSVRLSVCPSNAWIVTKRKKAVCRFLYHTKEHLS